MALEFEIPGLNSGSTYYAALIQRPSDGQIWYTVTPAFEAYNSAHYGSYVVALTELGATGRFTGNFPVGIGSANVPYVWEVRLQAGGSPAISDTPVASGSTLWNGTKEVSQLDGVDLQTIKTQSVTAAAGVTFPATISSFAGGAVASVTGAVGSVTGAVGSVTTGVTVSTNNDKTGYSLTQVFPANFASLVLASGQSVASPTNITAGTITTVTTVTNLTNAPTAGDFTSTMKSSLNAATPASVTGAVGSVTGNVGGNVNGTIGGYATGQDPATLLTASTGYLAAVKNAIWAAASRTLTAFGFTVPATDASGNALATHTDTQAISATLGAAGAGLTGLPAMTLTSAYDAAKSAAAPGAKMDLIDAPNATAITAIATGNWSLPITAAPFTTSGTIAYAFGAGSLSETDLVNAIVAGVGGGGSKSLEQLTVAPLLQLNAGVLMPDQLTIKAMHTVDGEGNEIFQFALTLSDGTLVNATSMIWGAIINSVVYSGLIRLDTAVSISAATGAIGIISQGLYGISFSPPAPGLRYQISINGVYEGFPFNLSWTMPIPCVSQSGDAVISY